MPKVQPSDDLPKNAHESRIAGRINLVGDLTAMGDGRKQGIKVGETTAAIRLPEAATHGGVPQLTDVAGGVATKRENVAEVRFVVGPRLVA